ncbi:hypothetical protein OKJ48_28425 [Streptomyces kunmingensis]|uniref:ATP-binding protein n=1 Tax=Streptomyces kunmingensis TaxID=68225 RepID=A0ABU6CHE5_9ACTN|nr:hypothetical protein [Streptomyces kunmingensis]MEB3964136.1 hypothetical protein [Streptomyces kunmingensis]
MARHAVRKNPMPTSGTRRALLRVGLTVTAAGAAVAAGAVTASAAPVDGGDPSSPVRVLTGALTAATTHGLGPVKNLQIDPLAGTGADPLDNAVGTQIADFKPVSTAALTGPLATGSSLSELPVVGTVAGVLPG